MQVKTTLPALSPVGQRAYDTVRRLRDQNAVMPALAAYPHRCELSVAEVAGVLARFPAGEPEGFPSETECAGLLGQVGHQDIPSCVCPVCLIAGDEQDELVALAARLDGVDQLAGSTGFGRSPLYTEMGVSRVELVAALYELSLLGASELAELEPGQVHRLVVEALQVHGRHTVRLAVDRLSSPPPSVWDTAFLELCERQIEVAFNLPRRPHYDYLLPWLAPAAAWELFASEHGPAPVPVSPAPVGTPAVRELVVA